MWPSSLGILSFIVATRCDCWEPSGSMTASKRGEDCEPRTARGESHASKGALARTSSGSSRTAERIPPEASSSLKERRLTEESQVPGNVSAAFELCRARQTVRSETPRSRVSSAMRTRSPSAAAPFGGVFASASSATIFASRRSSASAKPSSERSGTDLPVQAGVLLGAGRVMRSYKRFKRISGFLLGVSNGNPYAWCFGSFACKCNAVPEVEN